MYQWFQDVPNICGEETNHVQALLNYELRPSPRGDTITRYPSSKEHQHTSD